MIAWSYYCQKKVSMYQFYFVTLYFLQYLCSHMKWICAKDSSHILVGCWASLLLAMFCVDGGSERGGADSCFYFSVFPKSVLYVVCDRHFTGVCKLRVASFLHDVTHCSASCFDVETMEVKKKEKKDEVVCKNACINPLKHFPASRTSPRFFFSFFLLTFFRKSQLL